MYYMLVKIKGDETGKNYFIKSKYPFRNQQTMLNKMAVKYDIWEVDNFIGKPLTFLQYYLGIWLDKIIYREKIK